VRTKKADEATTGACNDDHYNFYRPQNQQNGHPLLIVAYICKQKRGNANIDHFEN
jgi:hypothetical protein